MKQMSYEMDIVERSKGVSGFSYLKGPFFLKSQERGDKWEN